MRSDTNQKHKQSLKLDVTSALKRQPTMGPLTSVKKSTTYLSSIHDEKLIGALKERIPVLAEKSARHVSILSQASPSTTLSVSIGQNPCCSTSARAKYSPPLPLRRYPSSTRTRSSRALPRSKRKAPTPFLRIPPP